MSLRYRAEVSRWSRQWRRGRSTQMDSALVCSSKDGSGLKSEQTRSLLVLRAAQIARDYWPNVLRLRANTQASTRIPPRDESFLTLMCTLNGDRIASLVGK